jgi:hypothetical protein
VVCIFEKDLESTLVREIESLGGQCLKFNSTKSGMPDRLVLLPGGYACFVEMKRPGEKPRPLQLKRKRDLEKLGFSVAVIDSRKGIKDFIKGVMPYDV